MALVEMTCRGCGVVETIDLPDSVSYSCIDDKNVGTGFCPNCAYGEWQFVISLGAEAGRLYNERNQRKTQ